MKSRIRTALAASVVGVIAFGGVATASVLEVGPYAHDAPSAEQNSGVAPRSSGAESPVQQGFVAAVPCRIADTRGADQGKMLKGESRLFHVTGTTNFPLQGGKAGGCAIPDNASAVVVSLSSTQASGNGYLRAWKFGGFEPTATVLSWTALGTAGITTGATIPVNGAIAIKAFGSDSHVIVDVTGYYVEPIVAVVGSGGNLGSHSKTVVSSSRDSLGAYTVNFSQNLAGCAVEVTADTSFYSAGSQILGTSAVVYTRNVTAAGSPYGDTAFYLTVTC